MIDDSREINKEFTGSIATGTQREFSINYSASNENPISDLEPVDTVPPTVVINQPIENDKYLRSDNLFIDYTATDDFSGLATTSLIIDSQPIATTTIDLFDYSLGVHNLTIMAIDKAGNRAEKQVSFEIMANIESTISDIERIYERGWLADKIYEKLLKSAFKLLKIQAKYFDKERELTERFIKRTRDNSKLTEEQKQKLIEKYNRKLAELKRNRQKAINRGLDLIAKLLDKAKAKGLINQAGYDIILSDINYLRINL